MAKTMDVNDEEAYFSISKWHSEEKSNTNEQLSLRYLNEFVGDLKCAAQLLECQLFPDAKEVTETMGVFNAIRKLHLTESDPFPNEFRNGIVVVGDGMTPRTAAMFASRTKGWICYSVDPIMRVSTKEAPVPWEKLNNVIPICAKIEDIRIRLNKAIVILVHAHVTMEQAMASIQANDVVAVLTLPCCNWYGRQEYYLNKHPDIVYDDMSILSKHREIRIWLPNHKEPQSIVQKCGNYVMKKYIEPQRTAPSALNFLQTMLSPYTPVDVPSDILTHLVEMCKDQIPRTSSVLVVGDQPTSCNALSAAGFQSVISLTSPKSELAVDAIIDVGYLHFALNKVEKTKSPLLVAELCRLYNTWLPPNSGHIFCLSGRRMLRNSKYFGRPSLQWTTTSKALNSSSWTTFLYHSKNWLANEPESKKVNLETLVESLDKSFLTSVHEKGNIKESSIHDILAKKDDNDNLILTTGIVSRINTLHAKLTLVDLKDADGNILLVLLRQDSLKQDSSILLPYTLLQHLQIGDNLQILGSIETTNNGSLSAKAIAIHFENLISRETLTYYQ
ncbi:hypothetical protein THRCLA_05083 [Thraustotheca clavata]|uniref:Uncharacterized protein n=1 Tax=Thraustotheca clavata TaxID=74557 RepID=A0A1V9ZX17_9STRA|nr:hypothetical protein THRCLA_05083 [Thraustotheca clavata]